MQQRMTENEVVTALSNYLRKKGWTIVSQKFNNSRGIDIEARKGKTFLFVEAKGAVSNNRSKERFDNNQIKSHFARAILKILELKTIHTSANNTFAIAQPDDAYIKIRTEKYLPFLKANGIKHFWVTDENKVESA